MGQTSHIPQPAGQSVAGAQAEAVPAPGAEWEGNICHFDATQTRRERLRRQATGTTEAAPAQPPAAPVTNRMNGQHAAVAGPPTPARSFTAPAPAATPVQPPAKAEQAPQTADTPIANVSAAPPAAAAVVKMSSAELNEYLINFVVEQTGYPAEMVELDADLEADLGIDSIKKAQLFGELAQEFDIPVTAAGDLSLDDFTTLQHVSDFLSNLSTDTDSTVAQTTATPPQPASVPAANAAPFEAPVPATPVETATSTSTNPAAETSATTPAMSADELNAYLVNFVVEQTGYPAEMVELDADLEADLGIDSIKKAQLFGELAQEFHIGMQAASDLSLDDFTTLQHVSDFLADYLREAGAPAVSDPAPVAPTEQVAPVAPSFTAPPAAANPVSSAAHVNGQTAAYTQNGHATANGQHTATATESSTDIPDAVELHEFLINFVVEQTGYPAEMVELDADLEADLGIDSIKKAQLFGELAEHFQIKASSAVDLSLDDFPTLRHVADFLADKR